MMLTMCPRSFASVRVLRADCPRHRDAGPHTAPRGWAGGDRPRCKR
jgi:hypothetical protein